MPPYGSESPTIIVIRRVLLATLVVGLVGTLAELLLLKHVEDLYQIVPVGLIGLALVSLIWFSVARTSPPLRMLQTVMVLFLLSGVVGAILHFVRNVADARESDPSLAGKDLYLNAIMGSTPALAPGTMIQLALIGLAFAYRHPALSAAPKDS